MESSLSKSLFFKYINWGHGPVGCQDEIFALQNSHILNLYICIYIYIYSENTALLVALRSLVDFH